MTRVIDTVLAIRDKEGNLYKRVLLTKEGIDNEIVAYYCNKQSKDKLKFITDVLIMHSIFEEFDLTHLSNYDEIQKFHQVINKTCKKINKLQSIYRMQALDFIKDMNIYPEYNIQNQTTIEELNFESIDIIYNNQDDLNYYVLRSYPLIPEFINNIHKEYEYIVRTKNNREAAAMSAICDEFLSALSENETIDEKYNDLIDEINKMSIVSKTIFFKDSKFGKDAYNNFRKCVSSVIYTEKTIFNNPETFLKYLFECQIGKKNIAFFEKLNSILIKADVPKPDYNILINEIGLLFVENNLENERLYMKNIVKKYSRSLFVGFTIAIFYSYYNSNYYNKLKKEINGDNRAQE